MRCSHKQILLLPLDCTVKLRLIILSGWLKLAECLLMYMGFKRSACQAVEIQHVHLFKLDGLASEENILGVGIWSSL